MITKKPLEVKLINPIDFYNLTDSQKTSYITRVKQWIGQSDHHVLQKMDRLVKRNLTAYHNDFYVHDFYTLLQNKVKKYIWMNRETGTDLIPLLSDDNFNNAYEWYNLVKKGNSHFYLIDLEKNRVQKIAYEKMDTIVNSHYQSISIGA